jgi:hypothetical protein
MDTVLPSAAVFGDPDLRTGGEPLLVSGVGFAEGFPEPGRDFFFDIRRAKILLLQRN